MTATVDDRIVMTDLVKRYGTRTVVKSVSADVRRGEVVGLLGPNGAGKTTTFYMVVGLVRPDGGNVALVRAGASRDITRAPMHERARAGIGYLAQENSIFRKLSVGDNLRLIWEMNGVEAEERERRLPALLGEFGLADLIDARGDSLSGGERRRVEIARAIATEPAFLLLDAPFTGAIAVSACSSPITKCARRSPSSTAPTSSTTARSKCRAPPTTYWPPPSHESFI